jgi:hypothetical protein
VITINVVKNHSVIKKESFKDIVEAGNKNEILEFMRTHNLQKREKGFSF